MLEVNFSPLFIGEITSTSTEAPSRIANSIISVPSSSGKSLQPLGSAFIFSVIQAATKRVFRKLHFCKKSGEVCEICVVGLPKTAVVCYVHGCRVKHFKIHRHSNFETRTLRTEHGRELDLEDSLLNHRAYIDHGLTYTGNQPGSDIDPHKLITRRQIDKSGRNGPSHHVLDQQRIGGELHDVIGPWTVSRIFEVNRIACLGSGDEQVQFTAQREPCRFQPDTEPALAFGQVVSAQRPARLQSVELYLRFPTPLHLHRHLPRDRHHRVVKHNPLAVLPLLQIMNAKGVKANTVEDCAGHDEHHGSSPGSATGSCKARRLPRSEDTCCNAS